MANELARELEACPDIMHAQISPIERRETEYVLPASLKFRILAALRDRQPVRDEVKRAMTDHGRMLWRDDVEGICPSIEMCFQYGDTVRCGPCAIKQAAAHGVETSCEVSYLPEVCRLQRELATVNANLEAIRAAMRRYLPPDSGITAEQFASEVIGIVDRRK